MKTLFSLLLVLVCLLNSQFSFSQGIGQQPIKLCVVTDIHYFDTTLLVQDGPAFQETIDRDRKLVRESPAITRSLTDSLIAENPDILLVCGDLTKDGELLCHQSLTGYFHQLEMAGTEIFVVPGNHDINNPHAVMYFGDSVISTSGVSPGQFRSIYNNYGFNQAIVSDTASLTYIAEPLPGLQLFMMDVCHYDYNYIEGYPETSGGFKPQVFQWVKDRLQEAMNQQKVVLGVMHHNLLEHFDGQQDMFPEYIIDDFDSISNELANMGMRVVFTGHFHAQDIIMKNSPTGNPIFDVQTGSPVTYPCPYRIMELSTDTILSISGKRIESIDYNTGSLSFQEYAKFHLETGLPNALMYYLSNPPYSIDSSFISLMTPPAVESITAHLEGNEGEPSLSNMLAINALKLHPNYSYVGYALESMWDDAWPDDWDISIDLGSSGNTVSTPETIRISKIKVFPVPACEVLNIVFEKPQSGNTSINLVNLEGRTLLHQNVNSKQYATLFTGNLPSGTYIVKINFPAVSLTRKILIAK